MSPKDKIIIAVLSLLAITIISIIFIYLNSPTTYNPNLSPEKSQAIIQEKEIIVFIDENGKSTENTAWKIKINDILANIPPTQWSLQIPEDSVKIDVKENNQPIEYTTKEYNEYYQTLYFQNQRTIKNNKEHIFNIKFDQEKNPIISEQFYSYKRTFKRFDTDNKFTLKISLPKDSEILDLSENPIKIIDSEGKKEIIYNFENGEVKTIKIDFRIPNLQFSPDETVEISTIHYTAKVPERYEEEYRELLKKADLAVDEIESIFGYSSPYIWKLETINYNDPDFEEDTGAFYLGEGRIRINPTHLQKTEKESLNIILHETVHGFNSKYLRDEIPNFWWEEGTAQYISYQTLKTLNYSVSDLKEQHTNILSDCQNQDLAFISEWSPNQYINYKRTLRCNNTQTTVNKLGYAYSYKIISDLAELYSDNVFQKFYKTVEKTQLNFSQEHKSLNNEVNSILSQALETDLTTFLRQHHVILPEKEPAITGLPIIEETEQSTIVIYILMVFAIIVIVIIIIRKKKIKKLIKNKLPCPK